MIEDEFANIDRWTKKLYSTDPNRIVVGIGDDAAVAKQTDGMQLVLTCDTMVEDVHFTNQTMNMFQLGYKCLAVNISDLAAMGAIPRYGVVAISVPSRMNLSLIETLYEGMQACASSYGVQIVGGDTTASPDRLVITITATGEVEQGRALLRSNAKVGDVVFVSKPLGHSAAGLHCLLKYGRESLERNKEVPEQFIQAHTMPKPEVALGRLFVNSNERFAVNDLSDGLASELSEIAEASKVSIIIDECALPIDSELKQYAQTEGIDLFRWVLEGGEEYSLIGTCEESVFREITTKLQKTEQLLFRIGNVVQAEGRSSVMLKKHGGTRIPLHKSGYNHFSSPKLSPEGKDE